MTGMQTSAGLSPSTTKLVGRRRLVARLRHELERGGALALRGDAGIGKSSLLRALADGVEMPVWRVAAPEARPGGVAGVDLAALDEDRLRPGTDSGLLLAVDDLPRLSPAVRQQVTRLREQRWCHVLVAGRSELPTGRDGRTPVGAGSGPSWWARDGWRSLEVPPLDRLATGELVAELVGGVVAPHAASAIHRASGGNPTGIVEVTEDARDLGSLVEGTEAWELIGPLPLRRLRGLVGDRLVGLDAPAMRALEVLALATPIPIRIATQVLAPSAVRELDRRHLVHLVGEGVNATVEMADPMVAEVVAGEMPVERRREHLRALVAGFERAGGPLTRSLRVAAWRLETSGWDAATYEAAAVRAYAAGDHDLAEALAARALTDGERLRARRLLAVTAAERGEAAPVDESTSTGELTPGSLHQSSDASMAVGPDASMDLTPETPVAAAAVVPSSDAHRGPVGVAGGDVANAPHGPARPAAGAAEVEAWTAMAHATVAAVGDGQWELACDRLGRSADHLGASDPAELDAYRAAAHAIAGHSAAAQAVLDILAARDGASEDTPRPASAGAGSTRVSAGASAPRRRATLARAIARSLTTADQLQTPAVAEGSPTGWLEREPDPTRLVPLATDLIRATALLTDRAHTPGDAVAAGRATLDAALRHPGPAGAYWSLVHAWLHERAGQLELARRRYVEAAVALEERDPLRLRSHVQAGRAYVAASMGMLTRSSMLLAEDAGAVGPRVRDRRALAEAVLVAAERGTELGATLALAAGDRGLQDGRLADAVDAWHLAVRLGVARPVSDRLADLAVQHEAAAAHPSVGLARAHAEALEAGDARALRAVAMQAARWGQALLAAEVAAQGARLRRDPAMDALASGLAAMCPDADTPALAGIDRVVLTPRRHQAAQLALQGRTGASIAERLGVSVRTVENHLAAVYRTLGVRGRRELATFYRPERLGLAAG